MVFKISSNSNIYLDLNECDLDMHGCHDNATCNNTDGSYSCECVEGYTGDGFNCTGEKRGKVEYFIQPKKT